MLNFLLFIQKKLNQSNTLSWIPLLAIRIYLAPIFLSAGYNKMSSFESTVEWFGNSDWGLGLPFPALMVILAIFAEFVGGLALLIGFATRWFSVSLVVTMLVAIFTVHWPNGWFAIAPGHPDTSMAKILNTVSFPGAESSLQNSEEVSLRLERAKSILRENGNYSWLTEKGSFVILNNGIEFAVTYLLMLLLLLCYGAGRYASLDYWIAKRYKL